MTSGVSAGQLPSYTTVLVDANAWVSRILATDSNHAAARTWLNRHVVNGGNLVAPELLIVEVAAAIGRQTGQVAMARQFAHRLFSLPVMNLIPVDSALLTQAADLAAMLRLRAADAVYAAVADQLGIPLVTFDGDLLTRTTGVIRTIRP